MSLHRVQVQFNLIRSAKRKKEVQCSAVWRTYVFYINRINSAGRYKYAKIYTVWKVLREWTEWYECVIVWILVTAQGMIGIHTNVWMYTL